MRACSSQLAVRAELVALGLNETNRRSVRLRCAKAVQWVVFFVTLVYPVSLVLLTVLLEGWMYFIFLLPLLPTLAAVVRLFYKNPDTLGSSSISRHTGFPTVEENLSTKDLEKVFSQKNSCTLLSKATSFTYGYLYFTLMLCVPLLFRQAYFNLNPHWQPEEMQDDENATYSSLNEHFTDMANRDGVLFLLKINLMILFLGVVSRENFQASSIVANRDLILRVVLDNLDIFSLASILEKKDTTSDHLVAPRGSTLEIAILVCSSLAFLVPYVFTAEIFRANSDRRQQLASTPERASTETSLLPVTDLPKSSTRFGLDVRLAGMSTLQRIAVGCAKQAKHGLSLSLGVRDFKAMTKDDRRTMHSRLLIALSPAAIYIYSLLFANVPFAIIRVYVLAVDGVTQVEFILKDIIGIVMAILNIQAYWMAYKDAEMVGLKDSSSHAMVVTNAGTHFDVESNSVAR